MMATIDPLLIDLSPLISDRLLLCAPLAGDGMELNEAIVESIDGAQARDAVGAEVAGRRRLGSHLPPDGGPLRERADLPMYFRAGVDGGTSRLIGGTALHRFDWDVPRFEIGYWVRKDGPRHRGGADVDPLGCRCPARAECRGLHVAHQSAKPCGR